MHKLAYTVDQFVSEVGMSKSKFYRLVKAGKITPKKNGKITLIPGNIAIDWLNSLPDANPIHKN